ncbi:MAG: substrate-binding domain-containing protein, partial [Chloroflexota bacterium]
MTAKKLSRRNFLKTASLAIGSSAVLAACAPSGGSQGSASSDGAGAASEEGVTVQYWVNWGGNYGIQTWEVLKGSEKFAEMMGANTIEVLPSAGDEKILTSIAAGTPPDGASNTQYLDFMARDVLIPLDDWIAASSIVKEEFYLEGSWKDGQHQGTMYGVPANEGFLRYALNYNSDMVAEAGLDPDSPPITWDELFDWHEALTEFDDAGNLIQIGLDPYDAMGGNLAIQDG